MYKNISGNTHTHMKMASMVNRKETVKSIG
jgi:hypothetical protein